METSETKSIARLKAWFETNQAKLAQAGVARIEGGYSGFDGRCQYDGPRVAMAHAGTYKLTRTAEKLLFGAVEDLIDRSGYRYFRGACGKLLLDVPTGRILHHHQPANENGVL